MRFDSRKTTGGMSTLNQLTCTIFESMSEVYSAFRFNLTVLTFQLMFGRSRTLEVLIPGGLVSSDRCSEMLPSRQRLVARVRGPSSDSHNNCRHTQASDKRSAGKASRSFPLDDCLKTKNGAD